jgi:hypothetical protein
MRSAGEGVLTPQRIAPQPAMAIKNAINIMNAAFILKPPTEWLPGGTTKSCTAWDCAGRPLLTPKRTNRVVGQN